MSDTTTQVDAATVAQLQAELARLRDERKAAEKAAADKAAKAAAEALAKSTAELEAAQAEAAKVTAEFAAYKRQTALWSAAQKAGVVSEKLLRVLDTEGLDPEAADFGTAFEARVAKWRESDGYAFAAPAAPAAPVGTGHGNEPPSGGTRPATSGAQGAAAVKAQAAHDFAALFGGPAPAPPAPNGGVR